MLMSSVYSASLFATRESLKFNDILLLPLKLVPDSARIAGVRHTIHVLLLVQPANPYQVQDDLPVPKKVLELW
jgi:hypothetical protein